MVALLVVLTIIGCLVADSIVLQMRQRRVAQAAGAVSRGAELIFAQDGGEPVDDPDTKEA